MSRLERLGRFFLRSPITGSEGRVGTLLSKERFTWARALIFAFYALIFFFSASNIFEWTTYLAATNPTPRWPVYWLNFVDTKTGIAAILWFHLLAGLIGIVFTGQRWARIAVFVSLLEFLSFKYSFGSINHGDHLSLLLSFFLIWLPRGFASDLAPTRRVRVDTLLVFSGCQAILLLTYTMSGFWKVNGVLRQVIKGEVHALMPRGLAQQVAAKLLEDDTTSFLGPWFIDHALLGWPLMIITLYIQFFAITVVARPALHLWWGLGLIAFHLSTHLLMAVGFPNNILWLTLFVVFSPFRPRFIDLQQIFRELPLLSRFASTNVTNRA